MILSYHGKTLIRYTIEGERGEYIETRSLDPSFEFRAQHRERGLPLPYQYIQSVYPIGIPNQCTQSVCPIGIPNQTTLEIINYIADQIESAEENTEV